MGESQQEPGPADSAEQLYRGNLELIRSAIEFVSGTMHLSEADREDFASSVHVKLIEDDYAVFRKFRGNSALRTYLVAVIKRFGIDFRNQRWGRWRPSTVAKRLGDLGVALETLMGRDGHTFAEAVTIMAARGQGTEAELEKIAVRLPVRYRRQFDSDEGLERRPGPGPTPLDKLRLAERAELHEKIVEATAALTAELGDQDRLILRMNFEDNVSVADIARALGLNQKRLYTRRQRILTFLRRGLEEQGFRRDDVAEVFGATEN